jgi:hypothetical protein
MMRVVPAGCAARCAAGLIAGVAAMLLSPQEAGATCGDYLVHRSAPLTAMSGSVNADSTAHLPTSVPGPRPAPCRGPHCSRGPAAPSAPLPPLVLTADQWGVIAVPAVEAAGLLGSATMLDLCGPPQWFAAGIFRPPRPVCG